MRTLVSSSFCTSCNKSVGMKPLSERDENILAVVTTVTGYLPGRNEATL